MSIVPSKESDLLISLKKIAEQKHSLQGLPQLLELTREPHQEPAAQMQRRLLRKSAQHRPREENRPKILHQIRICALEIRSEGTAFFKLAGISPKPPKSRKSPHPIS